MSIKTRVRKDSFLFAKITYLLMKINLKEEKEMLDLYVLGIIAVITIGVIALVNSDKIYDLLTK